MIKKLCSYCLNCVIETQKSDNIINLKKNKFVKESEKEAKNFLELKTIQKLNNSTMILYYCGKYYINDAPLFYKELNNIDADFNINISLILKYFENNFELLELFLKEIEAEEIKEENKIIKILNKYINISIEEKAENYIILSNIQEAKAGLIKELKEIIKKY